VCDGYDIADRCRISTGIPADKRYVLHILHGAGPYPPLDALPYLITRNNNAMKDEDKVITHEWLVSKGACYFDEEGEPDTALGRWLLPKLPISIEQLGRMRKIPARDKLWALYRLMSEEQCSLAARRSALRCIGNWEAEVPEVVLRWLREGREEDRKDAEYAAGSAAEFAARSAARSAAVKDAIAILQGSITKATQ